MEEQNSEKKPARTTQAEYKARWRRNHPGREKELLTERLRRKYYNDFMEELKKKEGQA